MFATLDGASLIGRKCLEVLRESKHRFPYRQQLIHLGVGEMMGSNQVHQSHRVRIVTLVRRGLAELLRQRDIQSEGDVEQSFVTWAATSSLEQRGKTG